MFLYLIIAVLEFVHSGFVKDKNLQDNGKRIKITITAECCFNEKKEVERI